MRVRKALVLACLAGLLAIPIAAAGSDNGVVASAKGRVHWNIPLPNPFGVAVEIREHSFNARKRADGSVTGWFKHHQVVEGESFIFEMDVTCLVVYDDGHRAKFGGVVEESNDPTVPLGTFGWTQVRDNDDEGQPDWSSLIGFGDETANEAFCNSPNLPRFGPWDVEGDLKVRLKGPEHDDD